MSRSCVSQKLSPIGLLVMACLTLLTIPEVALARRSAGRKPPSRGENEIGYVTNGENEIDYVTPLV